jgi:Histidine kinase-, DNA gyrase B-, and HSP90-like ATPase
VNSLRGLGYQPTTAVADLVDNSLTAGAANIAVEFIWDSSNSRVRVTDNGRGMSSAELIEAMRLGRDPSATRSADDLGRFGLGMKTASLSQARVLTVCSKTAGHPSSTFRWDIDHVESLDYWDLQAGAAPGSEGLLRLDDRLSGTIILWEKTDILLGGTDKSIDALFEIAEAVSKHLSVVFHRFISDGRVKITVNGATVSAWDPFMSNHPDCVVNGPQVLKDTGGAHQIVVTGYVLPPRSRLSDDEYDRGGGPGGWIAQQGFYVYRADRLLVAGGWLGVGRAGKAWRIDPNFSLARISLDITNAADLDWGIDVRKSAATPPHGFRSPLRQIGEEIRRRSKSALRAFRAAVRADAATDDGDGIPIWIALGTGPVPRFRINRRHPAVKDARDSIKSEPKLRALLNLIDRDVPVQPRSPGAPSPTSVDANRILKETQIRQLVRTIYYSHRNARGLSASDALKEMLAEAIFRENEALVVATIEEFEREKKG